MDCDLLRLQLQAVHFLLPTLPKAPWPTTLSTWKSAGDTFDGDMGVSPGRSSTCRRCNVRWAARCTTLVCWHVCQHVLAAVPRRLAL